ncbi:MAG TPA: 4a-hydroxytetrahydrobiopterin dehydratase [Thermoanaerobaculia bacterium]|jgi:4a-hydroxytetrahydrobiopterin dehydratase
MARPPLLPKSEVLARLAAHPAWILLNDRLHREFLFADFSEAFGFMARVALVAEKLDHHPDWSNVFNRVVVSLHTHDAGGLTELDFRLAAEMDRIAGG